MKCKKCKLIIKKFKRRKVYSRFKDDVWAADSAEMGSLSSVNYGVKFLLCVIDVFTKYAWVKPLTDKKDIKVLNGIVGIVNKSKDTPLVYGFIKEDNFTITLSKNGYMIMIF